MGSSLNSQALNQVSSLSPIKVYQSELNKVERDDMLNWFLRSKRLRIRMLFDSFVSAVRRTSRAVWSFELSLDVGVKKKSVMVEVMGRIREEGYSVR